MDIFRLVFIFVVFVLFIVESCWKKTRKSSEIFISFDFFSTCIVFCLFISVFVLRIIYKDGSGVFETGKFHNTYYKAKRLNYASNLDGIILLIEFLKILSFARVTNLSSLLYPFFVNSFTNYLYYFILIFEVILGFAVAGRLLWGNEMDEYNHYGNCIISSLLFLCGYYNVEQLVEINEGFTIVFVILFSTWKLLLVFPIIHAILAETFRRAVSTYGYPSDMNHENWNMNDFKTWFVHFIPERLESNNGPGGNNNEEENKKE